MWTMGRDGMSEEEGWRGIFVQAAHGKGVAFF